MFRLAWQCGYPHPRPMLETIDAVEYGELLAMLALEPLPDVRADLRAARQTWAALQPHSKRRLQEGDFVLRFGRPAAVNADERAAAAKAYQMKANQRYGMRAAAWDRRRTTE